MVVREGVNRENTVLCFISHETHSDRIKEFSIWFYSFFRDVSISEELEAFVLSNLENPEDLTVILTDWSKIQVPKNDTKKIITQEINRHPEIFK